MASRLITTSFAIASAAVLLAGCDSISNMFGHNSSQSSGSTGVSRSSSTGSGAPATGTYSSNSDTYSSNTNRSSSSYDNTGAATGGTEMVSADKVKHAQQVLKDQGFYKGPVDGIVGPQTRQALASYQRDHHLTQSSMLDDQTLRSIDQRTSSSR